MRCLLCILSVYKPFICLFIWCVWISMCIYFGVQTWRLYYIQIFECVFIPVFYEKLWFCGLYLFEISWKTRIKKDKTKPVLFYPYSSKTFSIYLGCVLHMTEYHGHTKDERKNINVSDLFILLPINSSHFNISPLKQQLVILGIFSSSLIFFFPVTLIFCHFIYSINSIRDVNYQTTATSSKIINYPKWNE